MDLAQMIMPSKTVEFDYPGVEGLKFSLAYLSKKELQRMRKDHLKMVKNKRLGTFQEELDEEGFMKEYVPAIIKGWEGLTATTVQEFIIVHDQEDPNIAIPYTEDNAYQLLTNSQDLDTWISEQISDIENFQSRDSKKNEEE